MTKHKLQAGVEIDFLSGKEYREEQEKTRHKITRTIEGHFYTGTTQIASDATGNVGGGINGSGVVLYETPVGFLAALHRVSVAAQGYTPLVPMNTGYLNWYRGGPSSASLVMFTPNTGATGVLPFVWSEGRASAPVFRPGEILVLNGASLAANTQIGISYQFSLWEVE
jgi:hypothetical protein